MKNATSDGVALQEKGVAPGVAATGEADQYTAYRIMMRTIGCQVEDAEPETHAGIKAVLSPEIVLKPNFVQCPHDYAERFPNPEKTKISSRSSLVISGPVVVESLELDGALVIECPEDGKMVVKDQVIKNSGWSRIPCGDDSPEPLKMRGYKLSKNETCFMIHESKWR